MRNIFLSVLLLLVPLTLVGCGEEKEKFVTIKEFKDNDDLRAEWFVKCRADSGFNPGTSCHNAYEANEQLLREAQIEKYKKLGEGREDVAAENELIDKYTKIKNGTYLQKK